MKLFVKEEDTGWEGTIYRPATREEILRALAELEQKEDLFGNDFKN